jgi:hypothetical protein
MEEKVIGRIFLESPTLVEEDLRSIKRISSTKVVMEAVLQDVDTLNRNKRVYPKKVIEEALKHPFVVEKLKTKSLLGESNHPPPGSSIQRQMNVDMNNVSHVIKEVYWDPKNPKILLGRVETAGTQIGKNLAGLILENGMQCSFSMRGAGDVVQKKTHVEVKSPMRLITWDNVHYPSHQTAYMRSIINEATTEVAVTTDKLAEYIAKESSNVQTLQESILCFDTSAFNYKIDDGKVLIQEAGTGRNLGFALMEAKLKDEFEDAMRSFNF